jgi:hypothetical protein
MTVKIWDKSMHIQGVESTTGHTIQFMFRISLKFPTLEVQYDTPQSNPKFSSSIVLLQDFSSPGTIYQLWRFPEAISESA